MKFTLVFPSQEGTELSIGAVFTPCLVWKDGNRTLLNPHPESPKYIEGDVNQLIAIPNIQKRLSSHTKAVVLIVHSNGEGTKDDLMLLKDDLLKCGFEPSVVSLESLSTQ